MLVYLLFRISRNHPFPIPGYIPARDGTKCSHRIANILPYNPSNSLR